jgi:hypothetical protein
MNGVGLGAIHLLEKEVIISVMRLSDVPHTLPALDWKSVTSALARLAVEVTESAVLGCLEPKPISSCYASELPRVRRKLLAARDGRLQRFRVPVNRNAFLIACRDYTDSKPEEHLLIGYGFRHGSTTKVESVHHVIGGENSVHLPDAVAHAMWSHFSQDVENELLIFHNHPYNPLNFLFDNLPLASRQDRLFLEARALQGPGLARRLLKQGRILFYVGENGYVKEFRLPSLVSLLDRLPAETA